MFGKARRISLKVKIVAALGVILVLVVPSLSQLKEAKKQAQQMAEIEKIQAKGNANALMDRQGMRDLEQAYRKTIKKRLDEIKKEEEAILKRGIRSKDDSRAVILTKQDHQRLGQIKLERDKLRAEWDQIFPRELSLAKPDKEDGLRPFERAVAYWHGQINEQERDIANKQKTIDKNVSEVYMWVTALGQASTPEQEAKYRGFIEVMCRSVKELGQEVAAPVIPVPKDRREIFEKMAKTGDNVLSEFNKELGKFTPDQAKAMGILDMVNAHQSFLRSYLQPLQDLLTRDNALHQAAEGERQVQPLPEPCQIM